MDVILSDNVEKDVSIIFPTVIFTLVLMHINRSILAVLNDIIYYMYNI